MSQMGLNLSALTEKSELEAHLAVAKCAKVSVLRSRLEGDRAVTRSAVCSIATKLSAVLKMHALQITAFSNMCK